ncbi:MAG TPA: putative lipid II flippase FtsW [Acidimicrobiia bacterium]|nr:putative lipid II flippase FtsW [Acidimicrobiia bacterium]
MRKTAQPPVKFSFVQRMFLFRHSDLVKAPRNSNFILLSAIVGVLNIIGVIMVLSASSVSALGEYGSAWFFFQRQLVWLFLGTVAFVVTSRIPYKFWQKYSKHIVIISFLLLFVVLIPGIGIEAFGSRRWLGVGTWRFQPSELAKFALVVFCADLLTRRVSKMGSFKEIMTPILLTTASMMFLVVIEPDYDSTVVLGLIVSMILVMSGIPFKHLTRIAAPLAVLATLVVFIEPYRRRRIFAFLHPFDDAGNTGYQIVQSLIALGSGQTSGVGLGAGKAKWLFLPNAHTDFIFSIIGEELGFVGTMMVVGLFVAFILLGIRIILSCTDRFSTLMATGIVAWIGGQAIINLMAVIGLLPVSGITLPFVSFGGSSLLVSMAATGVLANIARYSRV